MASMVAYRGAGVGYMAPGLDDAESDYDYQSEDDGPSLYEHAMYAAPYRDRLPNGELGAEYLPVSNVSGRSVSQALAEDEYRHSRDAIPSQFAAGSGGLLDYEKIPKRRQRADKHAENKASEAARVRRYMATHPGMPRRLMLAAVAYWEHSMTVAQVAKTLGVRRESAWDYIKDIRKLLRASGGSPPG